MFAVSSSSTLLSSEIQEFHTERDGARTRQYSRRDKGALNLAVQAPPWLLQPFLWRVRKSIPCRHDLLDRAPFDSNLLVHNHRNGYLVHSTLQAAVLTDGLTDVLKVAHQC